MNPLGYVFARARNSQVAAIALAQRIIHGKVGDVYFAQVYAHKSSGITKDDLSRMKGRSIGFGVPISTSNFLVPAYELRQRGFHPLAAFSRVEFLGGHDNVAKAVYAGKVDLGAGHDGVIVDLAAQPGFGDAKDRLQTVLESRPIPSDPIAVFIDNQNERTVLQEALVAAGKTPEGKDALAKFWGNAQGVSRTTPDAYDDLNASVNALALSERDLIR